MNMKIIIAAIGVAVLTSPVMAQSSQQQAAAASNARAQASIARAHGNVTRSQPYQGTRSEVAGASQVDIHDCSIKSVYTQCGFAH